MSSLTNANSLGLCASCLHARSLESAKGSQFLLCQLSQTDSRFPKYPRLPVLNCSGYQKDPSAWTTLSSCGTLPELSFRPEGRRFDRPGAEESLRNFGFWTDI